MPENCMHLQKAYGYEIIREKSLHPAPWIKKDQPLSSLFIVQKKTCERRNLPDIHVSHSLP